MIEPVGSMYKDQAYLLKTMLSNSDKMTTPVDTVFNLYKRHRDSITGECSFFARW